MGRRPDGALEHDIMTVLSGTREPLQPGDVKERFRTDLAYTSAATVLGRLHAKGLLERTGSGRAFGYLAKVDESELAARRINDVLSAASNRSAVIAGFFGSLSRRDANALRKMLDESER